MFSWLAILNAAKWIGGQLLGYLNTKVDADARVQIATTSAIEKIGEAGLGAIQNADSLNAKRSPWEPIMALAAVLFAFLVYHTVMIVLDSTPWHLGLGAWYLPEWKYHITGSWNVKALPAPFDTTEHAILQSVFVGASAAVSTLAIIKGLRR